MGKLYFHSIEVVWEMIAQEEWLGCRHDASPMLEIPGSTTVWASHILFFGFLNIKLMYMYIIFKIYIWYKRTLVVSDLVLARRGSENVFDHP